MLNFKNIHLKKFLFFLFFTVCSIFFIGCETDEAGITINRFDVIPTYALWIDENAAFTVNEEKTGLPENSITSVKWDFDKTDGINFDSPDAEGKETSHAYFESKNYTVSIRIELTDGTIFNCEKKIPVAKTVKLPAKEGGFFTAFDILSDGRIVALAGTVVMLQNSVDSEVYTKIASVEYADPAFIMVKSDDDTLIMGAGAGGMSSNPENSDLWQLKISECDPENPTELQKADRVINLPCHFAMTFIDDDHAYINNGADMSGSASYVSLLDLKTWTLTRILTHVSPSTGLWSDREGNLIVATCSPCFGQVGGKIIKYDKSVIQTALSKNRELNLEEGTLLADDTGQTQYAVLSDFNGNVFTSGNYSGIAPGYFSIDDAIVKTADKTTIKPVLSGTPGYTSLGTVTRDGKWMGWSCMGKGGYILPLK